MKKLTVTIAIPAYNEEANINTLLRGAINQVDGRDFSVTDIKLYLDGCTDSTEENAKKIKNKRLKIVTDSKRQGKSFRLNQIFRELKTDFLILFDADAILNKPNVVTELMSELNKDNTGLVTGVVRPFSAKLFLQKAIYSSIKAYNSFSEKFNSGKNIYSCKGAVLGLSKKFAKSIHVPKSTYGNDAYLYFLCITKGFEYALAKHAIVYTRLPNTVAEHIGQNTRFESAKYSVSTYFGDFVLKEFSKGKPFLYMYMLKEFFTHPIESLYIITLNSYCKFLAIFSYKNISGAWKIATSTKGGKA